VEGSGTAIKLRVVTLLSPLPTKTLKSPLELKEALGNGNEGEVKPDVVILKRLVTSVSASVLKPEAKDRVAACAKT
jgi:hypothetical protein